MVKLSEIDRHLKKAIDWTAAESDSAKRIKSFLDDINVADPEKVDGYLQRSFSNLAYLGKSERVSDKEIGQLVALLNELVELLPPLPKNRCKELIKRLTVARSKMVSLASRFTGELRERLNDLKKSENLLAYYLRKKEEGAKISAIQNTFMKTLKQAEDEVQGIIDWIGTTEAVLKEIQVFEGELKKLSG